MWLTSTKMFDSSSRLRPRPPPRSSPLWCPVSCPKNRFSWTCTARTQTTSSSATRPFARHSARCHSSWGSQCRTRVGSLRCPFLLLLLVLLIIFYFFSQNFFFFMYVGVYYRRFQVCNSHNKFYFVYTRTYVCVSIYVCVSYYVFFCFLFYYIRHVLP